MQRTRSSTTPNYTLQLLIDSPTAREGILGVCAFDVSSAVRHRVDRRRPPHRLQENWLYRRDTVAERIFDRPRLPSCSLHRNGTDWPTSTYPGTCNIPLRHAPVIGRYDRSSLQPQNLTDHPWIYNVSLSHKLNQDLLVYVNSGSSWRPPAVRSAFSTLRTIPILNSLLHVKSEKSY